jgi:hypothetical protein
MFSPQVQKSANTKRLNLFQRCPAINTLHKTVLRACLNAAEHMYIAELRREYSIVKNRLPTDQLDF